MFTGRLLLLLLFVVVDEIPKVPIRMPITKVPVNAATAKMMFLLSR